MPTCSAPGCKSRYSARSVTFHKIPKNPAMREKWIAALQKDDWKPKVTSVLCSKHFREDDFDRTSLYSVRLRDCAVPCLFPDSEEKELNDFKRLLETGDCEDAPSKSAPRKKALYKELNKFKTEDSIPLKIGMEPETVETENETVFEFVSTEDDTIREDQYCPESVEENPLQPVIKCEPVLVQTHCQGCGNSCKGPEIDGGENKKPILTTCESCSNSILPEKMDVENETEGEDNCSSEYDEEISSQLVENCESDLVQKLCRVCGNPFEDSEINSEENKRPLLTTCESCYNSILPQKMDLENETEREDQYCPESVEENPLQPVISDLVQTRYQVCGNTCKGPEIDGGENKKPFLTTCEPYSNSILPEKMDVVNETEREDHCSSEYDEEISSQPVKNCESLLLQKLCEVCGNPIEDLEIGAEKNKRQLLTTCERCSSYILPHKMHLENETEVCYVHQCDKCPKTFTTKYVLDRHKLTHSSSFPFKCKMCQQRFEMKDNLTKHFKEEHGQILINKITHDLICFLCGEQDGVIKVSVDNKALKICEACDLSGKKILSTTNNGDKLFYCDLCSRHFTRKDHTLRHRLTHMDAKPFVCYICQKSFTRNDKLTNHLKTHPNAKPFSCGVCLQAFTNQNAFKIHRLSHTTPIRQKHKCSVCQREFISKDRLQRHLITHEDNKDFKCEFCDESFTLQETLLSHQRVHSNLSLEQFKCTVCGLVFKKEKSLKSHLIDHSNVLTHTCEICFKKFRRKDTLKAHILTHTDIRPFECHVCNSAFKRKDKYVRHCRAVHKLNPEQAESMNLCYVCGEVFDCEDDLTEHKMTHYR